MRPVLVLAALWLGASAAWPGELLFRSDLEDESEACWAQPPQAGCHGWTGIHGMVPSSERPRSGEQALKVSFERNEDVGSATREIEARHVVVGFHDFYARGFDFAAGMKILRLSAFDAASQRNAFDIVLESRASAPDSNYCGLTDTTYLSIAYNGGPVDWGIIDAPFVFRRGRWYAIRTEVRLNQPGQSDGLVRVWVNGQKLIERTGMNLVGTLPNPINRIGFGGWYSNSAAGRNPCPDPASPSIHFVDDVFIRRR
ncbi:MAG TPA: hypothetical protein VFY73_10275 [Ideonella sp.]|uniref:polysaccharide lyase n=1 Tax=Ideonella sp. TaxID=1929293 RepID=UPI002E30A24B|nr:hypothetical protein [Ideonella sp.]HEX5684404.1 hypothetical protein [Ideonella sp.]